MRLKTQPKQKKQNKDSKSTNFTEILSSPSEGPKNICQLQESVMATDFSHYGYAERASAI